MKALVLILPLLLIPQQDNFGQFQKLYINEGFEVKFLFFNEGNGLKDNGVTLMIINNRTSDIHYSFTLIFRAENVDQKISVKGNIKTGEIKTGSNNGLFWIPFKDKRTITAVGITKIRLKNITE